MPSRRYESNLPDSRSLTNEQAAALLLRLPCPDAAEALFLGHVPLIRKCVCQHLTRSSVPADELEAAAIDGLWRAIRRAKPSGPGYTPYAYFRRWIVGALARAERTRPVTEDIDELADTLEGDDGRKAQADDELWECVEHIGQQFPAAWRVAWLVRARSNGWTWAEISAELGAPESTLQDRYNAALEKLREIYN